MDTVPITRLDELEAHLDELVRDPALPLNAQLFDHIELQLTENNIPPLIPLLLPKLTHILHQYPDDPTPLASLSIKLLGPVTFTQALALASQPSPSSSQGARPPSSQPASQGGSGGSGGSSSPLLLALDSPAPSANLLALALLHKAAATPADAALLSAMAPLVAALVRRWLVAPQVEVGQTAGRVIGDLLETDCELVPSAAAARDEPAAVAVRRSPGHGLMWRRLLLADRSIYTLILDLCAGRHSDTRADPKQLSLAQARLLRLLPRLAALNFDAVARSDLGVAAPAPVHATNGHPADDDDDDATTTSNHSIGRPAEGEGLLQFAALRMVDRRDALMHLSLVDFFEAFVSLMRTAEQRTAAQVATLRSIVGEAVAGDEELGKALRTLPERTVPEEADDLRRWLDEILPAETTLAVR